MYHVLCLLNFPSCSFFFFFNHSDTDNGEVDGGNVDVVLGDDEANK